jgi:cell division protein FtsB
MKYLPHTLIALIIAIQYPLWIGKGSWLRVWEVNKQLTEQKDKNTKLAERNAGLDADVRDLKEGLVAVEERARVELGMIKTNETFYQVIDRTKATNSRN